MKYELKNSFFDYLFFALYHLALVPMCIVALALVARNDQPLELSKIKTEFLAVLDRFDLAENNPSPGDQILTAEITQIRGDVRITPPGDSTARPAQRGETLHRGAKVQTSKKSGALLKVNGEFNLKIRIGPESEFLIEEPSVVPTHNRMRTFFVKLIRGTSLFMISGKDVADNFRVRTPLASFAVRGTSFWLNTDSTESNLVVSEGRVSVSQPDGPEIKSVSKGYGLWLNVIGDMAHGPTELSDSPLDWDLATELDALFENSRLREELRASQTRGSNPIESATTAERETFATTFEKTRETYFARTKNYREKINRLRLAFDDDTQSFTRESGEVKADIACLSARSKNCTLISEDLMLRRGFPSTTGNSKYIQSIIADLQAYLSERQQGLAERRSEVEELEELLERRIKKEESLRNIDMNGLTDAQLRSLTQELENDVLDLP